MQHSILHVTLLFILFGIVSSCHKSQPQANLKDTIPTNVVFDTIRKARIDSIVHIINADLNSVGGSKKIAYPLHNQNDTLYYWELKDDAARISIEWNLPNEVIWPTFFVYKGELIFVRYRYMYNEPPSNSRAFESMIYLDHREIIYCEERGQSLQEDEKPGVLKRKEHSRSTRSYAEIEKDYKEYWNTVKAYMKSNEALPSYIK